MKTKIFTLLFLSFAWVTFGQGQDVCATPDDDSNYNAPCNNYSHSTDPSFFDPLDPVVYNLKFWEINSEDTVPTNNQVTEDMVLDAIARMNIALNDAKIFIKYRGLERFASNQFDTISYSNGNNTYSAMKSWAAANGYKHPNAINVYIPKWAQNSPNGGFSGIASPLGAVFAIRFEAITTPVMLHELGHVLGLPHTFSGFNSSNCEHVTRDPNDPNYNAECNGDKIIDTPAQDTMWGDVNEETCEYIGDGKDCQDTDYQIYPEDTKNFMGYGGLRLCGNWFTVGQKVRMRERLANSYTMANAEGEIPDLFEPYKGEYFLAGPFDPTIHTPLFQPGFNYRFVECDGNYPQPADFYDTSYPVMWNNILLAITEDDTHYENIKHPNHSAIYIEEVDVVGTDADNYDYPRKCYDNNNKAAESGMVTKFNDGVLNANVTVMPQDSTSINNPQLIQNLQPGLYKIDKVYENGATEQTIIQKGNN